MVDHKAVFFTSKLPLHAIAGLGLLAIILYPVTGYAPVLAAPLVYCYFLLALTNWKAAYWLLLFFLPLSIQFSFAGDTLSLTLPAEPMMWLFFCMGLLLYAHNPLALSMRWWLNPVVLVLLLQLLWLLPAVLYSEQLFLSLKFLLAKWWVVICFFVFPVWVFRKQKDFRTGFFVLFIPVFATVLIILGRHIFMGLRFADMNNAVGSLYYNHVEYSTVISMFFPALPVAFLLVPKTRKRLRLFFLVCILIFLAAICFSYARAAVLAIVFAAGMGFALRLKGIRYVMPAIYGVLLLIVGFMIRDDNYTMLRPRFEHTIYHKTFSSHIAATFNGNDVSSMERVYRWIAALRMSRDRPLTGFGPNAFYYHYRPYTLPSFKTYSSINVEHSTTHNYFLYMLAEQGYPGMLLYALLMAVVFSRAQKTYHRLLNREYKMYCLALTMMIAACFVNNFFSELIETPKIGSLFYLCISLLVLLDLKSREIPAKPRPS